MHRTSAALALTAVLSLCAPAKGAADEMPIVPKKRIFTISMHYTFGSIPQDLQNIDFWFPMPFQDDHQLIFNRVIQAAYPPEFFRFDDVENEVIFLSAPGGRKGQPMTYRYTFDVERMEDLRNDFSARGEGKIDRKAEKALMERWMKPSTLVPLDKGVRETASTIAGDSKDTLVKARAIYDWLIGNVTYVATVRPAQGVGYGNLAFVLKEKMGNSVDFAAAFVGLSRGAGIPARSIIGTWIPHSTETVQIKNYEGWAEFYLEGFGWVPVDPASARVDPARRSYYFGALDENRLAISIGRDIVLVPPQSGDPLNYFVVPYWEGDSRPMATPEVDVTYRYIEGIPNRPANPMPSPARRLSEASSPAPAN